MLFRTHASAAILAGLMIEPSGLLPAERFTYYSLVLIAATIPDIDHENSRIGRAFPITSKAINTIFGHRGFSHAVLLPIGLWWTLSSYVSQLAGLAVLIGMITHLACDCLTKEGIALLSPLSPRRIRGFVTTGGAIEKAILFAIMIAIILRILINSA